MKDTLNSLPVQYLLAIRFTIGAALLAAHAAGDPAPLGQGSNTSMHRVRPRASQAEACRSLYERYRSAYLSGL